ncbi:hypothetical protein D9756_008524 [Leucocoprinus leucothites]|uniref:Uncharacterized protein n=1 Tax=Leucocoprinus leucothites TaxID=201217 RepID=A0A8H5D099_9AGAR|nr:hypothetical protein D9756_008524 [Leucoagaricus leucothites]
MLRRRSLASSSARNADITLTVDGKEVTVPQGSALIQACEAAGATIPRFVAPPRRTRLLLTPELDLQSLEIACDARYARRESFHQYTSCARSKHVAREGVMEFLLANHPLDCPICDQGGECDLQDQSMRYGADRTRFHEITGKRAVENKDLGPLVKTSMNRCIQCTRCVRFANEVAGVEEFGTSGRGNDMQIGTYVEKTMDSELSGNIIDLCPVGALTSKPYAYHARPWELKNTESIDVMDAVGSNIRIDSRGVQVMRIQPKTNDDVNEEWISDKTRYSYDGLKFQRLTTPLVKRDDRFVAATWEEALTAIAEGLAASGATGNEIQAVAGHLADTESLVALKDLANRLNSDNLTLDQTNGHLSPVHGVDVRSNYLFNSTIPGVEEADAILLVGTNPRHEAAVLNSRIRKSWLHTPLEVGFVGERADTTYGYEYLGGDANALETFVSGKAPESAFTKKWKEAKKPLIIVGSALAEHPDAAGVYSALAKLAEREKTRLITPEWNGFSVLQRVASRAASYEIGFTPSHTASQTKPKFIYLLNADEIDPKSIPSDAFVVYQGHHGDLGAQLADVCLPGSAYTEKGTTWVNTEGRAQQGRAAVSPPGAAREDWKIIRALSEVIGTPLPYNDILELRDRMWEISPALVRYDITEKTSTEIALAGIKAIKDRTAGAKIGGAAFKKPVSNFYQTDPISRASVTMAQCTRSFTKGENYGFSESTHRDSISPHLRLMATTSLDNLDVWRVILKEFEVSLDYDTASVVKEKRRAALTVTLLSSKLTEIALDTLWKSMTTLTPVPGIMNAWEGGKAAYLLPIGHTWVGLLGGAAEVIYQTLRSPDLEPGVLERARSYLERIRNFATLISAGQLELWHILSTLLDAAVICPNVQHLSISIPNSMVPLRSAITHILSPSIMSITFISASAVQNFHDIQAYVQSRVLPNLTRLEYRFRQERLFLFPFKQVSRFRSVQQIKIYGDSPRPPKFDSELCEVLSACERLEELHLSIGPALHGESTIVINPPNLRKLRLTVNSLKPDVRIESPLDTLTIISILGVRHLFSLSFFVHLQHLHLHISKKNEVPTVEVAFSQQNMALLGDHAVNLQTFTFNGVPFASSADELASLIQSWPKLCRLSISEGDNEAILISSSVLVDFSHLTHLDDLTLPLDFTFLTEPLEPNVGQPASSLTELRCPRWEGIPRGSRKVVILKNLLRLFPKLRRISANVDDEGVIEELQEFIKSFRLPLVSGGL